MESLYLIIPVSILLFGLVAALFMWSVGDGQYDDLEGEGSRILYEDDSAGMDKMEPLILDREQSDSNDTK